MTDKTVRRLRGPFPVLAVDLARFGRLLGTWSGRPGGPLCGRPFSGRQAAVPRPMADAARFRPAGVVTPDVPPADAAGPARPLQALIAIGHSGARPASLLQHYGALESESNVARLVTPGGMRVTVSRGRHDAICRLYGDLRDQARPEDSPAERAVPARALARRHDWPAPAALDDDLIGDPAYQPERVAPGDPGRRAAAPAARASGGSGGSDHPRRARTSRPGQARPGHRTSTTVRATAKTQLSRQGVPHGTATA